MRYAAKVQLFSELRKKSRRKMQKEAKKSTLPVLRKGADGASMHDAAVGSAPRKRESEVL
jgi:hypothetical protein